MIIREDLLGKALKECPVVFDYKVQAENNSLHNTPSCYRLCDFNLVTYKVLLVILTGIISCLFSSLSPNGLDHNGACVCE